MLLYTRTVLARKARREGGLKALVSVINDAEYLGMRYSAETTLTAPEAFRARTGNCLSLALVAAALADELGLVVDFQKVLGPDLALAAEGGTEYLQMVGHINLRVVEPLGGRLKQTATLDFLALPGAAEPRVVGIDRRRVLSMYYNNRAVESLLAGEVGKAYWWARASVTSDPRHTAGFITLGAIWQHSSRPQTAHLAYAHALTLDPHNANALANLDGLRAKSNSGVASSAAATVVLAGPTKSLISMARTQLNAGEWQAALKSLALARERSEDDATRSFLQRKWSLVNKVYGQPVPQP